MKEGGVFDNKGICSISEWNEVELQKTAFDFVAFFIKELSSLGTKQWISFIANDLSRAVKMETLKPAAFRTAGFDLVYFGPISANLKSDPEKGMWIEREPHFVLYDRSYLNLLPRERNILYNATDDLIEEAPRAYQMKVDRSQKDDVVFTFPQERYAKHSYCYVVPLL